MFASSADSSIRQMMRALLPFTTGLFLCATLCGADEIDFQRDIQPIFAEHCLECHGRDKAKGGLTLTTRDAVLKELESGAYGVVPGKIDRSELIQRLVTPEPDDVMPPKKKTRGRGAREMEVVV